MTRPSHLLHACACLTVLASLATAGCLCPPCPGKVAAGPAPAPTAGAPAAPAATGSRLVIWDGDENGTGAQSWADCDQKAACKTKAGMEAGVGLNGTNGIKFHGEGPGWIGMGWNLFGWYPENAGIDLTPYSHLTFQIRVEAKTPADAPEPGAITAVLGCSANKINSSSVSIEKYAKGFTDGKWHKVEIPIAAFVKGPGAKFDLQSFWELRISIWSGSPRNFDIYVDDIAAEKH